jgi:thiol-disulfide isomerase/thioredoxin
MSGTDPKMKLVKVSADFCAPCKAMEKAGVLEKFVARHPNVVTETLSIADKEGNEQKEHKLASKAANKLIKKANKALEGFEGGQSIPALMFFDVESGEALAGDTGGHSLAQLEHLYQDALLSWHELKGTAELEVEDDDEASDEEDEDAEEEEADDEN